MTDNNSDTVTSDTAPDTVISDTAPDTVTSDTVDSDTGTGDLESAPGEELVYGCPVTEALGQRVIHVERDRWAETAATMLADGWNMCVDLTSVDYLSYSAQRDLPAGVAAERFEVVASFISHTRRERIRARAQVPANDPTIESLYAIFPGTDFLEREVYDLMGITFTGHPDLSRILMPETWEGHPLRKDYAISAIPVQFKAHEGPPERGSDSAAAHSREGKS